MKKLICACLLLTSFTVMAMPSAVLFDCDGVLVDTEYMKYEAWSKALHEVSIALTAEEYMQVAGDSSKSIAKKIMAMKNVNFDAPTVIAHKNGIYKVIHAQGAASFKDAVQFLNNLLKNKQEYKMIIAVVSSDSHEAIMRNLKSAGVNYQLLDGIYSGHDDLKHINDPEGTNKPKPYIYQLAIEKLNIIPAKTLVFEDTNAGIISAKTAGLNVIAMPNNFTKNQDFSRANAQASFSNFTLQDLDKF